MRKDIAIMVSVTAVVIGVIVFLVVYNNPQAPVVVSDVSKLVRADSNMTGSASAKVTLVEFGDYECPACGASEPVIKKIIDTYAKNPNFNFVFRNFPLTSIHANALVSAEAAEAAGAQGKYFQMNELLYINQSQWSESKAPLDIFVSYAQQLNLDVNKFKQDVQSNKYANKINADSDDGNAIGINATPTFYLDGVQTVGVPLFDGLKAKIDTELAK